MSIHAHMQRSCFHTECGFKEVPINRNCNVLTEFERFHSQCNSTVVVEKQLLYFATSLQLFCFVCTRSVLQNFPPGNMRTSVLSR